MRICVLEHPRIPSKERFNDIANTPLWSCLMGGYAAGALMSQGHAVVYFDAAGDGLDFDAAKARLAALLPALLAVNAVYFWEHSGRLLDFIVDIKKILADTHVTLFGFFPSLTPEQILKRCTAVDSICIGECENTLKELAVALQKRKSWRLVPGLAFSADDRIHFSPKRMPAPNPDRFDFPYRPQSDESEDTETAAILASRGCYNQCAFCPIPVFYNRGALWRGRTPANIVEEVETLMDAGYRRFYFVDPNFIGPGKAGVRRTLALMKRLAPLKIRFGMETRPNDLDEQLLAAMTAAGLESLLLGIESASPGVLTNLSKHASADESRRAIDLCRKAGIEPEVGFLMHTPDATVGDLRRNLTFLETNGLLDRLERTANLLCHRQIVFRGTCGYDRYRRDGRILGTDPLGFEARIAWRDSRAEWVADVMVPVCLDVLRLTGDPQSPLYWKAAFKDRPIADCVNKRLVDTFRDTLHRVARSAPPPSAASAYRRARERVLADVYKFRGHYT